MKIQSVSRLNYSFGSNLITRKSTTVKDIFNKITEPIKKSSPVEKDLLKKSLGLSSINSNFIQSNFESHGGDIISGKLLPNIHVTTSGVSLLESVGNIINVELARIRGQLKRISIDSFNL